jgi:transcriptional regulator with XRE-family HTH domain
MRELRAERGVSQDALARVTGIASTAIGRLERGSREPRLTTILRIARGLGVQPGALTNNLAVESATLLERPVSAGVPLQRGSS